MATRVQQCRSIAWLLRATTWPSCVGVLFYSGSSGARLRLDQLASRLLSMLADNQRLL